MIRITSSWDDGSQEDLRIADLLSKYDIEGIFFIPVNWRKYNVGRGIEPLSERELEQILQHFELGSHGTDHLLLTRTDDSMQNREIWDSLRYWKAHRYRVRAFCYPRGYYTTEIKQKVEHAGYKWARTTRIGELLPAQDPYETHTTVHVGCDRKEHDTDWLSYAQAKIKEAIKRAYSGEKLEFHFWGHSAEVSKNDQWGRLVEFFEMLGQMK